MKILQSETSHVYIGNVIIMHINKYVSGQLSFDWFQIPHSFYDIVMANTEKGNKRIGL